MDQKLGVLNKFMNTSSSILKYFLSLLWVPRIFNVGLIGCGEIAQVVHIPTLNFFLESFKITYLCNVRFPRCHRALQKESRW